MSALLEIIRNRKLLLISACCLILSGIQAQDSLQKKNYHVVGTGIQLLRSPNKSDGHDLNYINYKLPAVTVFYRYVYHVVPGKSLTSANAYFTYRKGYGYSQSGGLGGGETYQGSFESCRFDLGLSKLLTFGKRNGFNIGGGFGLGALLYSKGEVEYFSYSGGSSSSSTKSISKSNALSKINFGVNFEMNQRFKVSEGSFVLIGSKSQLELPDGFGARLGLTETIFLAYMFR